MRILHTSDLHIGKNLNDFNLLEDQSYILGRICDIAVREKVDAVVIAGDLYDRSIPPSEAVVLLDDFLSTLTMQLHLPVIAISGNHDGGKRLAFASRLYESQGLYMESIFSSKIRQITLPDAYGEVHFWLIPYADLPTMRGVLTGAAQMEPPDTLSGAYGKLFELNRDRVDFSARNVLVGHSFFARITNGSAEPDALIFSESEVSVGGTDIVDATVFDGFDYVALGHLHAPQKAGLDTVRYSGSPLKYSISEADRDKAVVIVDLGPKGQVSSHPVPLAPLRDLRILTGYLGELTDRDNLPIQNFDDYVFVNLLDEGFVLDAMNKLRVIYPNVLGIRMVAQDEEVLLHPVSTAHISKKSMEDLFTEFYEAARGESLGEEQAQIMEDVFTYVRRQEEGGAGA
ncbi:exonuclease SbcCD subunit D [Zongyangia hominis]|uniref:Nuclease SbcCD subunit D n=1 Tax=Zongyangia hominis TaxID=2763677 RepID=A0A926EBX6_9FIRM|nr:exonuclease SbcCD subunit D [Zongyangia hominis]MBC8569409.1 exonuclease SbcCD subunit D [Zongyangia hominis]